MVSGHLIPKAPCASLVFLTGSVVTSRPWRPVACRSRGTPGIDSTAGGGGGAGRVAGDVAEEGQARVPPRDAGEADLLAGLAVVA